MSRQQLGVAPASGLDAATVAFVLANKGSGGGTAGVPVFMQQTDPALTTSYIWYQTDANGNLITVWTNFISAVNLLATDTFTGANGAAWASQWTVNTAGAGAVTQQSGRGQMLTSTGAYANGAGAYLSGITAVADQELYVEIVFDGTITEQYTLIAARVQAANANGGDPATGYSLVVAEQTGVVQLQRPGANIGAQVTLSSGGFVSSTWAFRFRLVGTSLKWRGWNTGTTEPTGWAQDTTDTTFTAPGKVNLSAQNGSDGVQRTHVFDNVTVNSAS